MHPPNVVALYLIPLTTFLNMEILSIKINTNYSEIVVN